MKCRRKKKQKAKTFPPLSLSLYFYLTFFASVRVPNQIQSASYIIIHRLKYFSPHRIFFDSPENLSSKNPFIIILPVPIVHQKWLLLRQKKYPYPLSSSSAFSLTPFLFLLLKCCGRNGLGWTGGKRNKTIETQLPFSHRHCLKKWKQC